MPAVRPLAVRRVHDQRIDLLAARAQVGGEFGVVAVPYLRRRAERHAQSLLSTPEPP